MMFDLGKALSMFGGAALFVRWLVNAMSRHLDRIQDELIHLRKTVNAHMTVNDRDHENLSHRVDAVESGISGLKCASIEDGGKECPPQ